MYRFFPIALLSLCVSLQSLSQDSTKVDTAQRIFEKVEIEASYPGGEQSWRRFLEKNLNPMVPVNHDAPSGKYTVLVQFIVDKEGRVSNVQALTNLGYGMEQEVIRIIKKSGKWIPALQFGKPVNAYRKQPISFFTEQDGFAIYTATPYVLYANSENELIIHVDNIESENLEVEISEGTINRDESGKFIASVKNPGRVVIVVYNKKKRKKAIGAMSFEVREPAAIKTKTSS